MSVPIDCPRCGETIGEIDFPVSNIHSEIEFRQNLGKFSGCNHPPVKKTESIKLFGLIKKIRFDYPETHTSSSWKEYVGHPNKLLLWVAIMLEGDPGVVVNHVWVYWRWKRGLYGTSLKELAGFPHEGPAYWWI